MLAPLAKGGHRVLGVLRPTHSRPRFHEEVSQYVGVAIQAKLVSLLKKTLGCSQIVVHPPTASVG
jgi:hypothetical protein